MQLVNLLWIGLLTFPQAFALDACAGQKFGYKAVDPADPHAYYLCFGLLGKIRNNCAEGFRFNVKAQNCAQVPQSNIQLKSADSGVRNEFNINQNITMDRPIIFNIFGGLWNRPPIPPFFPPKPTFRPPTPPTPPTIEVPSTESSSSSSEASSTESSSSSSVASSTESSSSSSEASSTESSSSSSAASSTESSSSSSEASSTESSSSSSEASSTESSSSSSEASSTESSSSSSEASSTESSSSSSEASSTESSSSSSEASSTESSSSSSEASSTESSSSSSEASSTESSSSSSEASSTESSSSSSEASSTESSSSSSEASSTESSSSTSEASSTESSSSTFEASSTESSTSSSEASSTESSSSSSEDSSTESSSSSTEASSTEISSSSSEDTTEDTTESSTSTSENSTPETSGSTSEDSTEATSSSSDDSSSSSSEAVSTDSSTSEDDDPSESSTDSLNTSSEESSTSDETDPVEIFTEALPTSSAGTETEDASSEDPLSTSENPFDETTESEDTSSSTSEAPILSKPIRADVGKLGKKLESILWIPTDVETVESPSEFDKSARCALLPSGAYLRDPTSCANFYVCANGRAILRKCPRNLYFDIESKVCNLPNLVDCSQQQESISIPKPLTYNFGNTVGNSIETTQSDENVLENSYIADDDLSTSLDSSAVTTDDLDDELDEDSETSESPTSVYTEEDIFDFDVFNTNNWDDTNYFDEESICSSQPNGVHLRHPNSCSKFYICASGRAVLRSCPSSLYFDIKKRVCNFPAAVDCSIIEDDSRDDGNPFQLTDNQPNLLLANTLRRAKSPKTHQIDSVTSGSTSIKVSAAKMEQNKSSATEILKTNNAALSSAKPHILPSQNANAPKKQGNLNNDLKYKGSASSTERVTSKDTSEVEQMQNKLSVSENIKSKEKPLASPILNESNDQGKPNMAQSLKTDLSKDQGKSNKDLTSKAAASSSTKTVIAKFTSEVKNEQSKLSVSESLKSKETSLPSTVTDLSKDINKLDKDLTSKAAASSSKEKSKLEEEQSKLSASENIKSKQTPLPSPILSQSNDQGKQNMAQNLKADQSKDQGKSNKDLITQAVASSSGTDLSKHTNKLDKDLTSTKSVIAQDTLKVKEEQSKLSAAEDIKSKETPLPAPILSPSNDQGKQNMAQNLKADQPKDQGKPNKDLTSKAAASSSTKTVIAKFTSEVKNEQSKLSVSESLKSKETSLPLTGTDLSNDINKPDKDLTSKAAASSLKETSNVKEEQSKLSASENIKSKETPLPSPILNQAKDQGKQNMAQNLKADQSKDQGKSNKDLTSKTAASSSTKSVIVKDTSEVKQDKSKLSVSENTKSKETPLHSPILSQSNDLGKQNMAQNLKADQSKDQGKPNKDLTSKAAASSSTKTIIAKFTSEVKNEQSKLSVSESLKSKEASLPSTVTDLSKNINKLDMDLTSKAAASSPKETSNVKEEPSKLSASESIKSKETPLPSPILNQPKDQGKPNVAQNVKADLSKDQGKPNKDLTSKTAASSSIKSVIAKGTLEVKQEKSKLSVSENTKSKEILNQSNNQGKPNMAQNVKADQSKDRGKSNKDLISNAAVSSSTKIVISKDTSEVKQVQSKLSVSENIKSKQTGPSSITLSKDLGKPYVAQNLKADLPKEHGKLDKDLLSKAAVSPSTKSVIAQDTSKVKQEQSKLAASVNIKSKESLLPSPILNPPNDQGKPNVAQSQKADLSKDQGKTNETNIIAKDTSEAKQDQSKLSDSLKSKETLLASSKTGLSKNPNSPENIKSKIVALPPTKPDILSNTSGVIQEIFESKQGQNKLLGSGKLNPKESKDQINSSVHESPNSNEKESPLMKSVITKDVSKTKELLSEVGSAKSSETFLTSMKAVTSNNNTISQQEQSKASLGKELKSNDKRKSLLMPKSGLTDSKPAVKSDPTKSSVAESLRSNDAILANDKSIQNLDQRKLLLSENLKSEKTDSSSTNSMEQIKPSDIVKSNKTILPSDKSNLIVNTPKPEDKHFKPTALDYSDSSRDQALDENPKTQKMSLAQSKADLSKTTLKAEQNKAKPVAGLTAKETVLSATNVDSSKEASQLKMVQSQPAVGPSLKSNEKVLYSTKPDHSKEHDMPSAAEALKYIEHLISSTLFDLSKNASALKNLQIVSKAENIIVPLEDEVDSKCRSLPNGAFIRDPNLCAKFYVCSNGRAIPHSCPNVLYFDIKKKVCNFPSLVDCTSGDEEFSTAPSNLLSPNGDSPSEPDDSPIPDCSLFPNGEYIRHPRSCSKFYVCANGKAIPRQCPKGLYIDTEIKYCNYPIRVKCKIDDANSPSGSVITGTAVNCTNKRDGTTMRDSEIHNKYYVCRNGTPVTHFCDPGKWFDLNRGVCVQKQLVDNDPLVPWL